MIFWSIMSWHLKYSFFKISREKQQMERLKVFLGFFIFWTKPSNVNDEPKESELILWKLAEKLDFFLFQLLWAQLEFDKNLLKLVNSQSNFKTIILEGLSRKSTGHKRRQGGLVRTVHGGLAHTSMSFPLGRSRSSRNERPRRTSWKRTAWPQGMELTRCWGKQTAQWDSLGEIWLLFLLRQMCSLSA